jgi:hypothetical protein
MLHFVPGYIEAVVREPVLLVVAAGCPSPTTSPVGAGGVAAVDAGGVTAIAVVVVAGVLALATATPEDMALVAAAREAGAAEFTGGNDGDAPGERKTPPLLTQLDCATFAGIGWAYQTTSFPIRQPPTEAPLAQGLPDQVPLFIVHAFCRRGTCAALKPPKSMHTDEAGMLHEPCTPRPFEVPFPPAGEFDVAVGAGVAAAAMHVRFTLILVIIVASAVP